MNDQASNHDAGAPMPHGLRAPGGGAPAASAAPSLDTKCQNPTERDQLGADDPVGCEKRKNKTRKKSK
jgi:hypothetical protein